MASKADSASASGAEGTLSIGYDPEIDIDWAALPVEGLAHHPDHALSLYGTRLWEALSPAQRARLGWAEAADAIGFAFVARTLLTHLLLRSAAEEEKESVRLRRTLAEIADNSRHLIMFARTLEALVAAPRSLGPTWVRRLVPFAELLEPGALTWAFSLLVNETVVGPHRELGSDPTVQPLLRMVGRIHVQDQARHIDHARNELFRTLGRAGRAELLAAQLLLAAGALAVRYLRVRPGAYRAARINPLLGWLVGLGNPVYSETLARQSERLVVTFQEAGLIEGPLLRALWRHSGLMRDAA